MAWALEQLRKWRGRIMRVKRGRACIAVEEGEGVGGGIPHARCGKILKSKTLKYAFSATLYQVFFKKNKNSLPSCCLFSTDVTNN